MFNLYAIPFTHKYMNNQMPNSVCYYSHTYYVRCADAYNREEEDEEITIKLLRGSTTVQS